VAIPDFQTIMRPLLVILANGQEHNVTAMRDEPAEHSSQTRAFRRPFSPLLLLAQSTGALSDLR